MEPKFILSDVFKAAWKGTRSQLWILAGLLIGYGILFFTLVAFAMPMQSSMAGMIVVNVISVLFSCLFSLGYMKNIFQALDGEEPQFSAYGQQTRNIITYFLASLLVGAIVLIGCTLFILPFLPPLPAACWPFLALSCCFHLTYYICISAAYKEVDLSIGYTIMRGCAPLITSIVMLCLGQGLSLTSWSGVTILCLGILALSLDNLKRHANLRGILISLRTSFVIAGSCSLLSVTLAPHTHTHTPPITCFAKYSRSLLARSSAVSVQLGSI